ncbi:hypothetical protein XENTR_v10007903 [Xenopus tropicalis]|nr:hypothetical protein XENTR_v10007903 [Xenopus tropicalis]
MLVCDGREATETQCWKHFYAFKIVPLSLMDPTEPVKHPLDVTEEPYSKSKRSLEEKKFSGKAWKKAGLQDEVQSCF